VARVRIGHEGEAVSLLDAIGVLLSIGLGVYLIVALLKPEMFE
jgi:K+-transporting ATPase KdpF subunit